eukprot:scaffold1596_cov302-Pinguiococcus_pyrenoidosus.AAC.72
MRERKSASRFFALSASFEVQRQSRDARGRFLAYPLGQGFKKVEADGGMGFARLLCTLTTFRTPWLTKGGAASLSRSMT